MKLQAHMPAVSIGARDWRAAMIALVSLLGVSALILALRSGGLVNNPLFERLGVSPLNRPQISVPRRVSLDLHSDHPIDVLQPFSVAHSLPTNVTSSQRFTVGSEARIAFDVYGQSALHKLANGRREHQLKPSQDRLMLMLMLLRLHSQNH
jgi:hypothetical protein